MVELLYTLVERDNIVYWKTKRKIKNEPAVIYTSGRVVKTEAWSCKSGQQNRQYTNQSEYIKLGEP